MNIPVMPCARPRRPRAEGVTWKDLRTRAHLGQTALVDWLERQGVKVVFGSEGPCLGCFHMPPGSFRIINPEVTVVRLHDGGGAWLVARWYVTEIA